MIRNQNNEVDEVSIGTAIMIFGLLLILFAPYFAYFTYTPRGITGYEDKTTRIPEYVSPIFFKSVGI
ncbi:MAG: hypothetical protein M8349_01120 [ANME-2 cluster archaeon]|nr:hypothetical protein [ANME-2 cluster archaeon]